jgi:hypothetical protein
VSEGELHIGCTHSIAMQECQASSDALLEFIRLECPFGAVKNIRICRN